MPGLAGLWNLLTAGGQSIVMKFKFLSVGKYNLERTSQRTDILSYLLKKVYWHSCLGQESYFLYLMIIFTIPHSC